MNRCSPIALALVTACVNTWHRATTYCRGCESARDVLQVFLRLPVIANSLWSNHQTPPHHSPRPRTQRLQWFIAGMISSSFWRVATTAPQTQLPAYVTSTVPRCVATHSLSYRRSHQRRYSSSKPSSPADGPKGIAEGQEVATAPAQGRTEGEKKASGRASRRKAKDVPASSTVKPKDEILHNLPSVPSTQHVKGKGKPPLFEVVCSSTDVMAQISQHLPSSPSTVRFRSPPASQNQSQMKLSPRSLRNEPKRISPPT
jgi:hypothetical protein